MKSPLVSYVGWLLLSAALLFYVYGMYEAISLSWGTGPIEEGAFPPMIAVTISSMQALLLTNLGVLLGISIAKPDSGLARQMIFRNTAAARGLPVMPDPLALEEKLQLFALVIYLLGLIACMIVCIHNDFSDKPADMVPLVAESGKMFIGVVLAYVTAIFKK